MFISYAQNFEDVILWRALKKVENGFYIDLGAQDPVVDSVSLAFYQKGWRGVHVEPVPIFAQRLRAARPDEEVIEAAVGMSLENIAFYSVGDTGLSSGNSEVVAQHRAAGFPIKPITVPCIHLSAILSRFAERDVHWLKIDVEGMEKDVIDSWMPSDVRPWIVVVESTRPNSPDEVFAEWEPNLCALGYDFKYFDGLNRYYLSTAHKELEWAFGPGPNYFDDFSLTRNSQFARLITGELNTLEQEIGGLRDAVRRQSDELHQSEISAAVKQLEIEAASGNLGTLRAQLAAKQIEVEAASENIPTLHAQLAAKQIEIEAASKNVVTLRVQLAAEQMSMETASGNLATLRAQLAAKQTEMEAASENVAALREQLAAQKKEMEIASETVAALRAQLAAEIKEMEVASETVAALRTQLEAASDELKSVKAEKQTIANDVAALTAEVCLLRNSSSWRVTAPLREMKVFSGFLRRGVHAWATLAPGSRPRRVGRRLISGVVPDLARSPLLKSIAVHLLRPFPQFLNRLRAIVRHQDLLRVSSNWTADVVSPGTWPVTYPSKELKNAETLAAAQLRTFYVFVDHTIGCSVNTGVQRTVRGLASGLVRSGTRVRYVKWDDEREQCVLINRKEREYLGAWNGPALSDEDRAIYRPADESLAIVEPAADDADSWLIVPEVPHITFQPHPVTLALILWAARAKLKTGFVFYDAIPLRRDEFKSMAARHAEYMQYLRLADAVWPISRWSADDLVAFWAKSERASGRTMPRIVPLSLPGAADRIGRVTQFEECERLILSVGTIEPRKNQVALINAFQDYRRNNPRSPWRLVLVGNLHPLVADAVNRAVTADSQIQHLGHVSDDELNALYRACAFTVFPSEEEGFGLPILESLWHGKPCICANFGSMAEVAAGGGCLTIDTREPVVLRETIESLMNDVDRRRALIGQAIARPMITWTDYAASVLAQTDACLQAKRDLGHIYFWVDSTLTFPKNTGIQRVTRQLARQLLDLGFRLVPVKWDSHGLRFAPVDANGLDYLARWNGPKPDQWCEWIEPGRADSNSWFMMTELPLNLATEEQGALVRFASDMRLRCGAVFYDAIPWKMRGMYPKHFSLAHRNYMIGLDQYDLVLPISDFSGRDLVNFLGAELARPLGLETRVRTVALPGEFAESPRVKEVLRTTGAGTIVILCVGTVEPRKNHLKLLQAFAGARARSVVPMRLIIAGRRTEPGLARDLEAHIGRDPSISWEEDADDGRLRQLHMECDFTVYPSLEEGFGLPIVESLWYAKPCICADFGAMAEVAIGGGCVLVDVRDEDALARAIQDLAENPQQIEQLSRQAIARSFKSWNDYARMVAIRLADASRGSCPEDVPLASDQLEERARAMRVEYRPKLSVCISTYNRAEWLSASLRNWTRLYPAAVADVELFVCDNTSTDSTPEIVKPYLDRADFSYRRNPKNVGMLGNLRETAQHARGEYIWILGDDDLLMPGAIERVLKAINENPGVALVYLNYAFTRVEDARSIADFDLFFRAAIPIVPGEADLVGPIREICARNENFFTAIYTLVLRRDHAIGAYSQDTSGRPFSTMLTCIPTTHYVLKNMIDEPGVWIGAPQIVINLNVSWMNYASLWILERIPEVYDIAELKGVSTECMDRWRRHTLPGVVHYFREIFRSDPLNNAAYFSPERLFRRFKHLPEFLAVLPELREIYRKAHVEGHPAAAVPVQRVFPEFGS